MHTATSDGARRVAPRLTPLLALPSRSLHAFEAAHPGFVGVVADAKAGRLAKKRGRSPARYVLGPHSACNFAVVPWCGAVLRRALARCRHTMP